MEGFLALKSASFLAFQTNQQMCTGSIESVDEFLIQFWKHDNIELPIHRFGVFKDVEVAVQIS
jgi:hypothetical protein